MKYEITVTACGTSRKQCRGTPIGGKRSKRTIRRKLLAFLGRFISLGDFLTHQNFWGILNVSRKRSLFILEIFCEDRRQSGMIGSRKLLAFLGRFIGLGDFLIRAGGCWPLVSGLVWRFFIYLRHRSSVETENLWLLVGLLVLFGGFFCRKGRSFFFGFQEFLRNFYLSLRLIGGLLVRMSS